MFYNAVNDTLLGACYRQFVLFAQGSKLIDQCHLLQLSMPIRLFGQAQTERLADGGARCITAR